MIKYKDVPKEYNYEGDGVVNPAVLAIGWIISFIKDDNNDWI